MKKRHRYHVRPKSSRKHVDALSAGTIPDTRDVLHGKELPGKELNPVLDVPAGKRQNDQDRGKRPRGHDKEYYLFDTVEYNSLAEAKELLAVVTEALKGTKYEEIKPIW